MYRFIPLVLAAALAACGEVKSNNAVIDADQAMVAGCTYVADVAGTSVWSGAGGSQHGWSKARNEARESAAQKGATHIVWNGQETGYITSVSGKAYRCNK
ncbi:MAG: hypothetical protein P4L92_22950 [Rudaea sp.]|nr:hypothetical protein [Rudaea sp.]